MVRLLLEWILQKQAGQLMLFTQQKSYHFNATDTRYASQDPFIQSTLSHTISTPICTRSAFFLRRTQLA